MKNMRLSGWWFFMIAALLVVNAMLLIRKGHQLQSFGSDTNKFKFANFYTNGIACTGVEDAHTGKPMWIEWNFGDGENPGEESYLFFGTNLCDLYFVKGRPPVYKFIFHGPGKSETWWMSRGGGEFNERIFYNTNGVFFKHEVWLNDAWHLVDRREDENGVNLGGRWQHLGFDKDGNWTLDQNR